MVTITETRPLQKRKSGLWVIGALLTSFTLPGLLWRSSQICTPPRLALLSPVTEDRESAFITYVIISETSLLLDKTLMSLVDQSNESWDALVIYNDTTGGLTGLVSQSAPTWLALSEPLLSNNRVQYLSQDKGGCNALQDGILTYVKSKWVCILQEGQVIDKNFRYLIEDETLGHPHAEVILFQPELPFIYDNNATFLSPVSRQQLCNSGCRTAAQLSYVFQSAAARWPTIKYIQDDFSFLSKVYEEGYQILISQHLPIYFSKPAEVLQTVTSLDIIFQLGTPTLPECIRKRKEGSIMPRFDFPDKFGGFSKYWDSNIDGLSSRLRTVHDRCPFEWPMSNATIEVIFHSTAEPKEKYYIVMKMEQLNSAYYTDKYISKLKGALQIWDFSYAIMEAFRKDVNISSKSYYVPTRSYASIESPPIHCPSYLNKSFPMESSKFELYANGIYVTCTYAGPGRFRTEPLGEAIDCNDMLGKVDVLFYGSLKGSANNGRESLCDQLYLSIPNSACLQSVFGHDLSHYVCHAKLVMVDTYYEEAALGTHRIDALLLAGKPVVAAHSGDPFLDAEYAPFVVFADPRNLLKVVKHMLEDLPFLENFGMTARSKFLDSVNDSTHICHALIHLAKDVQRLGLG